MVKTIRHNLALKLDLWGFSASAICAIHCAIMPFIIAFLPLIGLQFFANPFFEYTFIAISLIIGSFTFKHGYLNHHKKLYPFLLFLSGFAVILFGHIYFHDHSAEAITGNEHIHENNNFFFLIAPLGAIIIAISHLINRGLSKTQKNCCDSDIISQDLTEQNS